MRALARDLGEQLGCGAYLGALTRTASGPFTLERAHPLDAVREALAKGRAASLILPPDFGLDAYPKLSLPADDLGALARGQIIRHRSGEGLEARPDGLLRVMDAHGRPGGDRAPRGRPAVSPEGLRSRARLAGRRGCLLNARVPGRSPRRRTQGATRARIVHGVDALPAGLRFVATLGVFDGVHRGHRLVLDAT